jgi:NAD(P)H-nitrite reductase large subunit
LDNLKDEQNYVKEDRADLVARVMAAQEMARFLLKGYSMLRSYGVDFMKLPEWIDQSDLDEARKLKPHRAQEKIIAYFQRLNHALSAAVRRKQFRVIEKDPSDAE